MSQRDHHQKIRSQTAPRNEAAPPVNPPREFALPDHVDPLIVSSDFLEKCKALGLQFEPGDVEKLGQYLALLLAGNEIMNLTAVTEPAQMWRRHIFDSLTLVPLLVSADAKTIIDIGSGGGLPGIPLAIVMPEVRFTLLESTGKKATFLERVVQRIGLKNVSIVNERAEVAGRDRENCREKFDAATIRAVGHLAIILELSTPFVHEGGYVFAVKGERAAQEVAESKQALHLLHAEVAQTLVTETSTIVVIEKRRRTPKLYPRSPGEPKRVPLGLK